MSTTTELVSSLSDETLRAAPTSPTALITTNPILPPPSRVNVCFDGSPSGSLADNLRSSVQMQEALDIAVREEMVAWWEASAIRIGDRVVHPTRGSGVVKLISSFASPTGEDRVHVAFESGEVHRYARQSWFTKMRKASDLDGVAEAKRDFFAKLAAEAGVAKQQQQQQQDGGLGARGDSGTETGGETHDARWERMRNRWNGSDEPETAAAGSRRGSAAASAITNSRQVQQPLRKRRTSVGPEDVLANRVRPRNGRRTHRRSMSGPDIAAAQAAVASEEAEITLVVRADEQVAEEEQAVTGGEQTESGASDSSPRIVLTVRRTSETTKFCALPMLPPRPAALTRRFPPAPNSVPVREDGPPPMPSRRLKQQKNQQHRASSPPMPSRRLKQQKSQDRVMACLPPSSYTAAVAIVDDSAITRMLLLRHVRALNLDAVMFSDGEKLLERTSGGDRFRVILMDNSMPIVSGADATRTIREEYKLHSSITAIVGLTATSAKKEIRDFQESGCDVVFLKPLDPDDFKEVVHRFLKPFLGIRGGSGSGGGGAKSVTKRADVAALEASIRKSIRSRSIRNDAATALEASTRAEASQKETHAVHGEEEDKEKRSSARMRIRGGVAKGTFSMEDSSSSSQSDEDDSGYMGSASLTMEQRRTLSASSAEGPPWQPNLHTVASIEEQAKALKTLEMQLCSANFDEVLIEHSQEEAIRKVRTATARWKARVVKRQELLRLQIEKCKAARDQFQALMVDKDRQCVVSLFFSVKFCLTEIDPNLNFIQTHMTLCTHTQKIHERRRVQHDY